MINNFKLYGTLIAKDFLYNEIFENDHNLWEKNKILSLTSTPCFNQWSFEELRMHDYSLGYRNKIVFPQNYAQNQFFIPAPPNYNYPNPSNSLINVNQNNIMKGNQSINSGSNYYPSYTEKPDQNNNILYNPFNLPLYYSVEPNGNIFESQRNTLTPTKNINDIFSSNINDIYLAEEKLSKQLNILNIYENFKDQEDINNNIIDKTEIKRKFNEHNKLINYSPYLSNDTIFLNNKKKHSYDNYSPNTKEIKFKILNLSNRNKNNTITISVGRENSKVYLIKQKLYEIISTITSDTNEKISSKNDITLLFNNPKTNSQQELKDNDKILNIQNEILVKLNIENTVFPKINNLIIEKKPKQKEKKNLLEIFQKEEILTQSINYPIITQYESIPSMTEIFQMEREQLTKMKNFIIKNEYGKIEFLGEINITNINFDKDIMISKNKIEINEKNTILKGCKKKYFLFNCNFSQTENNKLIINEKIKKYLSEKHSTLISFENNILIFESQ